MPTALAVRLTFVKVQGPLLLDIVRNYSGASVNLQLRYYHPGDSRGLLSMQVDSAGAARFDKSVLLHVHPDRSSPTGPALASVALELPMLGVLRDAIAATAAGPLRIELLAACGSEPEQNLGSCLVDVAPLLGDASRTHRLRARAAVDNYPQVRFHRLGPVELSSGLSPGGPSDPAPPGGVAAALSATGSVPVGSSKVRSPSVASRLRSALTHKVTVQHQVTVAVHRLVGPSLALLAARKPLVRYRVTLAKKHHGAAKAPILPLHVRLLVASPDMFILRCCAGTALGKHQPAVVAGASEYASVDRSQAAGESGDYAVVWNQQELSLPHVPMVLHSKTGLVVDKQLYSVCCQDSDGVLIGQALVDLAKYADPARAGRVHAFPLSVGQGVCRLHLAVCACPLGQSVPVNGMRVADSESGVHGHAAGSLRSSSLCSGSSGAGGLLTTTTEDLSVASGSSVSNASCAFVGLSCSQSGRPGRRACSAVPDAAAVPLLPQKSPPVDSSQPAGPECQPPLEERPLLPAASPGSPAPVPHSGPPVPQPQCQPQPDPLQSPSSVGPQQLLSPPATTPPFPYGATSARVQPVPPGTPLLAASDPPLEHLICSYRFKGSHARHSPAIPPFSSPVVNYHWSTAANAPTSVAPAKPASTQSLSSTTPLTPARPLSTPLALAHGPTPTTFAYPTPPSSPQSASSPAAPLPAPPIASFFGDTFLSGAPSQAPAPGLSPALVAGPPISMPGSDEQWASEWAR
eukprot:gene1321-2733_t